MLEKRKVMAFIIFLVLILTLFILTRTRNCNTDYSCFEKSLNKCSIAKVNTYSNDNFYKYEIIGRKKDNCIVEITLLNLSEKQSKQLQEALEGRSMRCSFSKETIQNTKITEIQNINDYCTGPLKEATLEITVEQMYDLIVKNLGQQALKTIAENKSNNS